MFDKVFGKAVLVVEYFACFYACSLIVTERLSLQKNEKKILERWKMLVKGLLVRERIRRKYDFRVLCIKL